MPINQFFRVSIKFEKVEHFILHNFFFEFPFVEPLELGFILLEHFSDNIPFWANNIAKIFLKNL